MKHVIHVLKIGTITIGSIMLAWICMKSCVMLISPLFYAVDNQDGKLQVPTVEGINKK